MEADTVNRQQSDREHQLAEKLGNAENVLHHAVDVTLCPKAVVVDGDHDHRCDDLNDRRNEFGRIHLQRRGVHNRHHGVADETDG